MTVQMALRMTVRMAVQPAVCTFRRMNSNPSFFKFDKLRSLREVCELVSFDKRYPAIESACSFAQRVVHMRTRELRSLGSFRSTCACTAGNGGGARAATGRSVSLRHDRPDGVFVPRRHSCGRGGAQLRWHPPLVNLPKVMNWALPCGLTKTRR